MSNTGVSPISRSLENLPNKRARIATPSKDPLAPPRARIIDPTYGQSCAFPGLDDGSAGNTEQLFYGPAEDGLEYLRMVRSEARNVPNLLVAPSQSLSTVQAGGADGFYSPVSRARESSYYLDGTYASICAENIPPDRSSAAAPSLKKDAASLQEMFALSLLKRFDDLHRNLKQAVPSKAFSTSIPGSLRYWRDHIISTPPSPHFVAQLEQSQILIALCALEDLVSLPRLSSFQSRTHRYISAWTISLLAACRDVGDMDSEDVGVVRGLGKSATTELRRLEAFGVSGVGPSTDADKNANRAAWDRNTSSPSSASSQGDSLLPSANHDRDAAGDVIGMDGEDGDAEDDLLQARNRLLQTLTGNNLGDNDDSHNLAAPETPIKRPKSTATRRSIESPMGNSNPMVKNNDMQRAHSLATEELEAITKFPDREDDEQQQQQQQQQQEEGQMLEREEGEVEEEDGGEEEEEEDDEWENGGAAIGIRALYESVIVLTGRRYGQKDLLDAITPW